MEISVVQSVDGLIDRGILLYESSMTPILSLSYQHVAILQLITWPLLRLYPKLKLGIDDLSYHFFLRNALEREKKKRKETYKATETTTGIEKKK